MTLNARFILKCALWTARLTYVRCGFWIRPYAQVQPEGAGGPSPPPCGQLTRCFSAVAELLVYATCNVYNGCQIQAEVWEVTDNVYSVLTRVADLKRQFVKLAFQHRFHAVVIFSIIATPFLFHISIITLRPIQTLDVIIKLSDHSVHRSRYASSSLHRYPTPLYIYRYSLSGLHLSCWLSRVLPFT